MKKQPYTLVKKQPYTLDKKAALYARYKTADS